ncbi:putative transcriptional regulator [Catalinimonas alkaloidigena]|uniref:UPF0301 protein SAMN05421823_10688 n=1 Tax=Catalinimonas alkaloidigena TaxID=1075417 RepID=A0A1G9K920_9BACT|nr:YqgE/AlgH family protein [Catalinimonas alkaloidigena]SDL46139.1 putative transcriptional regulator [Catalinimonas alkaloidigena]
MENDKSESLQGHFLISEPFLPDPNFERSVVLICEHSSMGAFGLILNRPTEVNLYDALEEDAPLLGTNEHPLFVGGPVEPNTLHFLHAYGNEIEGSIEVVPGLFWGGDFEQIKELLVLQRLDSHNIRFFVGYSGWGSGQLERELAEESWITTPAQASDAFLDPPEKLWQQILRNMGGKFRALSNYPRDPRLN